MQDTEREEIRERELVVETVEDDAMPFLDANGSC